MSLIQRNQRADAIPLDLIKVIVRGRRSERRSREHRFNRLAQPIRLGIIQAFEADPPLLILDEPTEGLDPLMQETVYLLIKEARQKGSTVFMSSHVLSEVERICDRIALLRKGELVVLTDLETIRATTGPRALSGCAWALACLAFGAGVGLAFALPALIFILRINGDLGSPVVPLFLTMVPFALGFIVGCLVFLSIALLARRRNRRDPFRRGPTP